MDIGGPLGPEYLDYLQEIAELGTTDDLRLRFLC
jgi:hypothetical protein